MLTVLCTTLLLLIGILLMFIVLLQRGRGGGLAGAFGGLGGKSAFGTKAGDVFTRITIVLAVIWVALAGVTGYAMRYESSKNSFKSGKKLENPEITTPPSKTPQKREKAKPPKQPVTPDDNGLPDITDGKKKAGGKPSPDPKSDDDEPESKKPPAKDDIGKKVKTKS